MKAVLLAGRFFVITPPHEHIRKQLSYHHFWRISWRNDGGGY